MIKKAGFPYNQLGKHFLEEYCITECMEYEIKRIRARELLSSARLDMMAKLIYLDAKMKKMNVETAAKMCECVEDIVGKEIFEQAGMESLIENFSGSDKELLVIQEKIGEMLIPIGDENVLLNGVDWVVIAAYYDWEITGIFFSGLCKNTNYEFLLEGGLSRKYLEWMVLKYCHLQRQIYCVCVEVGKSDKEKRNKILQHVKSIGNVIYISEYNLGRRGIQNFEEQIYGSVCRKKERGKNKDAIIVGFFDASFMQYVSKVKDYLEGIELFDSHEQIYNIANLVLNENSVNHMKCGRPNLYGETKILLLKLKKKIKEKGLNIEDFIIDSSSSLSIWGIRSARDMDYLSQEFESDIFGIADVDNHENQLKYYKHKKQDLIYNPENYFVYMGMKFVSLMCLRSMKQTRGERKDVRDVRLIDKTMRNFEMDIVHGHEGVSIFGMKIRKYIDSIKSWIMQD